MDGWLAGMLLPPVLHSDLAVLVPGNQKPPCPGLCQADLMNVPRNAALETGHHWFIVSRGKPCPSAHPFQVFPWGFFALCDLYRQSGAWYGLYPLWLLKMWHTNEPWKGQEFFILSVSSVTQSPEARCFTTPQLMHTSVCLGTASSLFLCSLFFWFSLH